MPIQSFKELNVWRKAIELVKAIYQITEKLPASERFCLMSQMQRAAISIPSNIAEGTKRKTRKDYYQFLCIADGSCSELETQLIIASELYRSIHTENALLLLQEVQRMLGALMKAIGHSEP